MRRVNLFVVPPASPHTVAAAVPYLAGHLIAHGHEVRVADLNAELARAVVEASVIRRLSEPIADARDIPGIAAAERQVEQDFDLAMGYPDSKADATWADVAARAASVPSNAIDLLRDAVFRHLDDLPGMLGFSCLSQDQLAIALRLAREAKRRLPDQVVIVGGPMLTTACRFFPDDPPLEAFDYIVANNGAMAFEGLMTALASGVPYESDDIVHGGRVSIPLTLKRIGLPIARPAPPVFPAEVLTGLLTPRPVLPVYSAQGCSYGKCNFCSSQRSVTPYRPSSMTWIVAEMDRLHAETGTTDFDIVDNNFDPHRIRALARALREGGRSYRWKATARFYDEFDEPFLAEAVEAGCGLLCLGLESYNDDALAGMEKGYTTATIDRVLDAARNVGLPIHLYAIVGHPSETAQSRHATITYLKDRQDSFASVYLQVYDANLSFGVFVSESAADRSTLRSSVTSLASELADHFPDFGLHEDDGGVLVRRLGYPRSEELFFVALTDPALTR